MCIFGYYTRPWRPVLWIGWNITRNIAQCLPYPIPRLCSVDKRPRLLPFPLHVTLFTRWTAWAVKIPTLHTRFTFLSSSVVRHCIGEYLMMKYSYGTCFFSADIVVTNNKRTRVVQIAALCVAMLIQHTQEQILYHLFVLGGNPIPFYPTAISDLCI